MRASRPGRDGRTPTWRSVAAERTRRIPRMAKHSLGVGRFGSGTDPAIDASASHGRNSSLTVRLGARSRGGQATGASGLRRRGSRLAVGTVRLGIAQGLPDDL